MKCRQKKSLPLRTEGMYKINKRLLVREFARSYYIAIHIYKAHKVDT